MNDQERVKSFCEFLNHHHDRRVYDEMMNWTRNAIRFYGDIFRRAGVQINNTIVAAVVSLTQEALWMELCVKSSFRGKSQLKTYVWQITRFKILDVKREQVSWLEHVTDSQNRNSSDDDSESPSVEDLADPTTPDPEDEISMKEKIRIFEEALTTLPDDDQKLMEMMYVNGLRHTEIAEKIGKSVGSIKVRIFRDREIVREFIQKKYGVTF